MYRYLVVLTVLLLWAGNALALPGAGTEGDPWLIQSLADFDVFADPANSATYWASGVHTRLDCDPNLAGRTYTTAVIAPDTSDSSSYFDGTPFEGIFDGDGHVIRNLTIDTAGAGNNYLGLFGQIEGFEALVENLCLENVNITGGFRLGGLCGSNESGTITNCYSDGSVTGFSSLGGLCGYNKDGTITNCYSGGSVTGGDGSYNLGGLCGRNSYGTITNCYSGGSVTGDYLVGGLCGRTSYGTITNCYSSGSATTDDGSYYLGALCGNNHDSTITNCYFYLFNGPDNHSGTALDELQMQDAASFVGFDFAGNSNDGEDDYWTIVNGHCPKLTWQTDDGRYWFRAPRLRHFRAADIGVIHFR